MKSHVRQQTGPTPAPGREAVLYVRVSSKEQEQGFSIPAQRKLLTEYAGQHSVHLLREFEDVETAKRAGRTAFGEMVALLAAEGSHAAAVLLESLWNDLQRVHTFSLFCGYPLDAFDGRTFAAVFGDICAEHSLVIPGESFTGLETAEAHEREVARLQQRAASLEAEMEARERL